jgi:hypothetical protein
MGWGQTWVENPDPTHTHALPMTLTHVGCATPANL